MSDQSDKPDGQSSQHRSCRTTLAKSREADENRARESVVDRVAMFCGIELGSCFIESLSISGAISCHRVGGEHRIQTTSSR
ncbi:MAG: hypothetical protein M4D80_38670, partial [Myxococcota bacterium]|nr:hypothetical protein [Myxococcota bacterium]